MNLRTSLQLILAAAALVVAGSTDRASANIVTVGNLGTINMTAGTQSGTFTTIPVFDAGGAAVQMSGWQLAIRIVPLGGATGTVTVDVPSRAYQPGHIIADPFPAAAPYTVANTPLPGDTVFGSNSNSFSAYTVNASGQNLLGLKFNASGLASGNFDIRLVEVNENSYWTDAAFVNQAFFVNGTPLTLQTPGSLSLGTISVSAAAVPEPSSLLLSGAVVGFAGWRARRKRRKEAEAAATVAVATPAV
jgi:hypothetical protein